MQKLTSSTFDAPSLKKIWNRRGAFFVKFAYSEKATKFFEIFTLLLTGTTYDKVR